MKSPSVHKVLMVKGESSETSKIWEMTVKVIVQFFVGLFLHMLYISSAAWQLVFACYEINGISL